MYQLNSEGQTLPPRQLFRSGLFWIFILLMFCAGASEHGMAQWASYFAETSLHISKSTGDLLGPCLFALLMGTTRAVYGAVGDRFPLQKILVTTGLICFGSYLTAVFSPLPILSLIACGFCGLSVGLMWPGVFNLCAKYCTNGGTAMYAFMALAGDIGCSGGPTVVGMVANACENNLKPGLLAAIVFPIVILIGIAFLRTKNEDKKSRECVAFLDK